LLVKLKMETGLLIKYANSSEYDHAYCSNTVTPEWITSIPPNNDGNINTVVQKNKFGFDIDYQIEIFSFSTTSTPS
jgi:hypothetical protein